MCCRGRALALTLEEAIKFWDTFLIIYQIQVSEYPKGFYIKGQLSAHFDFSVECPFLKNELCSIYENRPAACRIFPWNFDSIYGDIIFRPKGINKYYIKNLALGDKTFKTLIKDLKKPYLELCGECNSDAIIEEKRLGYVPLENLLFSVDRNKIRKDLKYQNNLFRFLLNKFPFHKEELKQIARLISFQKADKKEVLFIASHIINLGFLYALSLLGKIDFNRLLKTQIELFSKYDITRKFLSLKEIYESIYANSYNFEELFESIRSFVENNDYPF